MYLYYTRLQKSVRYRETIAVLLRVAVNFASAISSKTEQGSTLLEDNKRGHVIHNLIKDWLICVALHLKHLRFVFKISRKANKESVRFKNFRRFCRIALHCEFSTWPSLSEDMKILSFNINYFH